MVQVFFSYSHEDESFRTELEKHLSPLRRQGIISTWHDRKIPAGSNFEEEISSELESSQVILLLVSSNFISSDYCYEQEMQYALKKHEEGSAIVIPVIIHPCDWHDTPFGKLRATPTDGKAVSMYENRHEAFTIIARDVRNAISKHVGKQDDPKTNHPSVAISSSGDRETKEDKFQVKREYSDLERDDFIEECFEYLANYFQKSLDKLSYQNPHVETKFRQQNQSGFSAFVYVKGDQVAQCSIYHGEGTLIRDGIAFSNSGELTRNSFNEFLGVVDDGYSLYLKSMGMLMIGKQVPEKMSKERAAKYLWRALIRPLQ